MPFAAIRMGLEFLILSEVRQRKTDVICYCLYVEINKQSYKELIYKTNKLTDTGNNFMVTKGERGERDKLRVWD